MNEGEQTFPFAMTNIFYGFSPSRLQNFRSIFISKPLLLNFCSWML